MKMYRQIIAGLILAFSSITAIEAAEPIKIGVINFKQAVEQSKLGKQEQASFEALKKQAEQVLQEKEKQMMAIGAKLEDPDYMDSLSPEADAELKHKFRLMNQELAQQQQQLYQTLSQANFKIVQKLTEAMTEAAKKLAEEKKLDIIVNEDACFYFAKSLDKTADAVKVLDETASK